VAMNNIGKVILRSSSASPSRDPLLADLQWRLQLRAHSSQCCGETLYFVRKITGLPDHKGFRTAGCWSDAVRWHASEQTSRKRYRFMKSLRTGPTPPRIAEVLDLIKEADSVELKLTVPDTDQRSAVMLLDMEVLDAEIRQVVFFDTPDLKLNRSGMIVRARRARRGGDTVIKLRPVVPAELPTQLRRSSSFNVEVDAMPGAVVCSGSLKGNVDNSEVKVALRAVRPIRKLFSREQRAFYKAHAPKNLDLDSLTALGPINTLKLKLTPQSFRRSLVAEMWFYPDGSRILELSTKCRPEDAFQVLAETRAFLIQREISLTGKQETKTRRALEYFSRLHTGKKG
jgi:hypothetical protein